MLTERICPLSCKLCSDRCALYVGTADKGRCAFVYMAAAMKSNFDHQKATETTIKGAGA